LRGFLRKVEGLGGKVNIDFHHDSQNLP